MINYVKFVRGTPAQYAALIHKDTDTLYFICEADESTAELYLGTKLIADAGSSDAISSLLANLQDVLISEGLAHSQLLVYDGKVQAWVNKSMEEAFQPFIGANNVAHGKTGLVPAPTINDANHFLRGDGKWAPVSVNNILVIENVDDLSHAELINQHTMNMNIVEGDIIVIKESYDITSSYIYNGVIWVNLNGRIDSNNIVFADSAPEALKGQSLNTAFAQLTKQIEQAANTLIDSVSSDFNIDETKQLKLNNLSISKVTGLEDILASIGTWSNFS